MLSNFYKTPKDQKHFSNNKEIKCLSLTPRNLHLKESSKKFLLTFLKIIQIKLSATK